MRRTRLSSHRDAASPGDSCRTSFGMLAGESRTRARPRGGDRLGDVVLYGGGVRKTLTGAPTLPNRQPGGRSGDRAAAQLAAPRFRAGVFGGGGQNAHPTLAVRLRACCIAKIDLRDYFSPVGFGSCL